MKVVVGIPARNEVRTIARTIATIDSDLQRQTRRFQATIVLCDNNSTDGTKELFAATPTVTAKVYLPSAPGTTGKGVNLLNLLAYSSFERADAVLTIDADVTSLDDTWASQLLNPVLSGEAEYVMPLYRRSPFEGSTTNHFAYPLLYALTGKRLRQPIGGEFALGKRFLEYVLRQRITQTTRGYGVDMFLSSHAAFAGFGISEVPLGRKIHNPSFPKIKRIFTQECASGLGIIGQYGAKIVSPNTLDDAGHSSEDLEDGCVYLQRARVPAMLLSVHHRIREDAGRLRELIGSRVVDELLGFCKRDELLSMHVWVNCMESVIRLALKRRVRVTTISQAARIIFPVFLFRSISFWERANTMKIADANAEINEQARMLRHSVLDLVAVGANT